MEKSEFIFQLEKAKGVYSEVGYVIDKTMSEYSVDGRIKRFDFDDGEVANSIFNSGENLVKVRYSESFGNVLMDFEIFGNGKDSLEKIESELKTGLESLL